MGGRAPRRARAEASTARIRRRASTHMAPTTLANFRTIGLLQQEKHMFHFNRNEVKVLLVAVSRYIERSEGDAEDIATARALEEQVEAWLTTVAETGKTPPCACERDSTCNVAHDPATCPC